MWVMNLYKFTHHLQWGTHSHLAGGKIRQQPHLLMPAPKLSKRCKKNFQGELEELHTRVAG